MTGFETKEHFGIAMEHVSEGELFDYVQKQEGMKEEAAKEMFRGIVNGMQHCHSKGIAHRDLKLENILLDKENVPKVSISNCKHMLILHRSVALLGIGNRSKFIH